MRKFNLTPLLIILLIITIIGSLLIEYVGIIPSGQGDWLSYWGSLIGVISSGIIASLIAMYQVDKSKEEERGNFIHQKQLQDLLLIKEQLLTLQPAILAIDVQKLAANDQLDQAQFTKIDFADLNNQTNTIRTSIVTLMISSKDDQLCQLSNQMLVAIKYFKQPEYTTMLNATPPSVDAWNHAKEQLLTYVQCYRPLITALEAQIQTELAYFKIK